ncbi:unnamed protein product [Pleuronectes platessa]|uniref:Uncharacterized protein n=1 Tax=Pleuronectes platessa TaxID=8262 RepID=A0A9N7VV46_PLEPL|nr:unnamed protein product [Pleuronectes platessa]
MWRLLPAGLHQRLHARHSAGDVSCTRDTLHHLMTGLALCFDGQNGYSLLTTPLLDFGCQWQQSDYHAGRRRAKQTAWRERERESVRGGGRGERCREHEEVEGEMECQRKTRREKERGGRVGMLGGMEEEKKL